MGNFISNLLNKIRSKDENLYLMKSFNAKLTTLDQQLERMGLNLEKVLNDPIPPIIKQAKDDVLKTLATSDERSLMWLAPILIGWPYIPYTYPAPEPAYLTHIFNDIIINKRKSILEFGAGLSTILMGRLLKLNKIDAEVKVIDDSEDWISVLRMIMKDEGTDSYVKLIYSPSKSYEGKIYGNYWYDVDYINDGVKDAVFDCVLVDGPVGHVCKYSRYGAGAYVKDRLAPKFAIFLHDAVRLDEQVIIKKWKSLLPKDTWLFAQNNYAVFTYKTLGLTMPKLNNDPSSLFFIKF